jgi:hypothetical protein
MGNVNKMKEKWANKEAKVWFMEAQKWTQHMVTIANRKYKHSLSNRLDNGSRPHSDGSQECMMSNSCRG